MTQVTEAYDWSGRELIDAYGSKVGTIEALFQDQQTEEPEWAAVKTGLFGTKLSFVPIEQAVPSGESLRVPFSKDQIKDAPNIDDSDGQLSQQQEAELYAHYGMSYGESRSESGLPESESGNGHRRPVGHDVSGPTTDDAMTRSEEEVRIGTADRERGRARLRKYVVTEQVQKTVPVRREEVRIEREPITDANVGDATSGPEISSEEHEVVLHEEEPVAEKRAVPKERVRLDKDVQTEERQVSDTVRKEEIEVDDARRGS